MQYTYELRDRKINTAASVLEEMHEALSGHVFLDKGNGPIERGFTIKFLMPTLLIVELFSKSQDELDAWRRGILSAYKIQPETLVYVHSKIDPKNPIFVIERGVKRSAEDLKNVCVVVR